MKTEDQLKYLAEGDCLLVEAMKIIDQNTKGIIFVVNQERSLLGVLTDGDIRRWIIKTGKLDVQIHQIMNPNPKFVYEESISTAEQLFDKNKITALPVLSNLGKVEDILFNHGIDKHESQQKKGLEGIPVVVMAGGKGTRLYPYTKILPKPLIPIGDIPIIERIFQQFAGCGTKDFWVTVNYKKNMIMSYFAEVTKNYNIHYVEENAPLGTGGSLHLIQDQFQKPIIVTNCDILIEADYEDIYKHHLESGNKMTIVTALKNIIVPYGVVHLQENGTIDSMEEKPKLSYFVNTGFYIINQEIVQKIPKNQFFHMTDLADLLMKEGEKVGMYPISEDSFLDMGEFEEMHRMEEKLEKIME